MLDQDLANFEVKFHLEVLFGLGLMLVCLYDKLEHVVDLALCQV